MSSQVKSFSFRVLGTLLLAAVLATGAGTSNADTVTAAAAANEAASVNAVATAARLCNVITEAQLNRATARMDTVHARQLARDDRETYLILRSSESFRNKVFASALNRVRGGCSEEVTQVWREIAASLMFADIVSQDALASNEPTSPVRN